MALQLPHLGPRMRKVVFYAGMVVLALVTFVFAIQATFPYDRVKARIEQEAASKYDLTISEIDRGILPGVFYLRGVTLKTRPKAEDAEKAYAITDPKERDKAVAQLTSTIYVDKIRVSVGLLSAIGGKAEIDFDAAIGDGTIHGTVALSKAGTSLHVVGEDVPSELLPMREVLSNLPMSGEVELELDFDLPNEKLKNGKIGPDWTKATGEVEFQCPSGCTIGDGKSKLKLKAKNQRSQAYVGEGTDFGRINVQSLAAKVEIKDGKADLTKFDFNSTDVELNLEYTMTFAEKLDDSAVLGCVRFKGTEALRKREPKTYDQVLLTGAYRHTDGLDHILLKGTFKDMKKLPQQCGPNAGSKDGDPDKPSRPTLTVQPDEPTRPGPGSAATTVNPPPPPTPATPIDAGVVATDAATTGAPTPAIPPGPGSSNNPHDGSAGSGTDHGSAPVPEGAPTPVPAPGDR